MIKKIRKLGILAGIVLVCLWTAPGTPAYAGSLEEDTATPSDASQEVITETPLVQSEDICMFSNASDGSFSLEYALDEEYLIGYGTDADTELVYCMVEYQDVRWLVLAGGDSPYIGRYDISRLSSEFMPMSIRSVPTDVNTVFEIDIYNNETDKKLITDAVSFTGNYSLLSDGWSENRYFVDGVMCRQQALTIKGKVYYFDGSGHSVTNEWVMIDGVNRYFNEQGFNSISFYTDDYSNSKYHRMLRVLEGNTWTWAGDYFCDIDGQQYYFNADGRMLTNKWQSVGTVYRYFDPDGVNTCCYYNASYPEEAYKRTYWVLENGQWIQKKNYLCCINGKGYYFDENGKMMTGKWKTIDGVFRYFDHNGVNTRGYYSASYENPKYWSTFRLFENNQWVWVDHGFYMINGKYYYFHNGKRYTGTAWIDNSSTIGYYVNQGVCTNRLVQSGNKYSYYKCVNGNWVSEKSIWAPEKDGVWYGFDTDGTAMRKYHTARYAESELRGTVWNYTNGEWVQVKNEPLLIGGSYYCVTPGGQINRKQGWYSFSDTRLVYVDANGKISHYVNYFPSLGCSIYKLGNALNTTVAGLKSVKLNGKTAYYYSDENGNCYPGERTIGEYQYSFNQYGIALERQLASALHWDFDKWMGRVCQSLLGAKNMHCDEFVRDAFAYAGECTPSGENVVRYQDSTCGGIVIDGDFCVSAWSKQTVRGKAVVSDQTDWKEQDTYILNKHISEFSYDELDPGDLIIYYKNGKPSHISLYIGQFPDEYALLDYLNALGISQAEIGAQIRTWGQYYENDATHWCIHGGMGSNQEVYISNTCYTISDDTEEYAVQIVNILE